jgi:hypothetical protein
MARHESLVLQLATQAAGDRHQIRAHGHARQSARGVPDKDRPKPTTSRPAQSWARRSGPWAIQAPLREAPTQAPHGRATTRQLDASLTTRGRGCSSGSLSPTALLRLPDALRHGRGLRPLAPTGPGRSFVGNALAASCAPSSNLVQDQDDLLHYPDERKPSGPGRPDHRTTSQSQSARTDRIAGVPRRTSPLLPPKRGLKRADRVFRPLRE